MTSLERFDLMRSVPNTYMSIVIENVKQKKIIAHATLLVELKLARGLAVAAHIEDVVVHSQARGHGFGKKYFY